MSDTKEPAEFDMTGFIAYAKQMNDGVAEEFRENKGVVARFGPAAPMILITHTGAKSGKTYTTPLVYSMDGDRYVIIASMGGAPVNPQWFRNIVANPEVTVEVGAERFPARAHVAEGAERDRLYAERVAIAPDFKAYQDRTTRVIPVVTLERV